MATVIVPVDDGRHVVKVVVVPHMAARIVMEFSGVVSVAPVKAKSV
jgi:hypothetical protein